MKLVIASENKNKILEIKQILGEHFTEIVSAKDMAFTDSIEENGSTFYENALIKARAVSKALGLAALSDDSGLCVDALDGAPGVHSARYAGFHGDDEANNQKLLLDMQGRENRACRFVSSVVLCFEDGTVLSGEGVAHGRLLCEKDGQGGFGYDPLFFSNQLQKSFGQASAEEKNAVSHRKKALTDLLFKLKQYKQKA